MREIQNLVDSRHGDRIDYAAAVLGGRIWRGPRTLMEDPGSAEGRHEWTSQTFEPKQPNRDPPAAGGKLGWITSISSALNPTKHLVAGDPGYVIDVRPFVHLHT